MVRRVIVAQAMQYIGEITRCWSTWNDGATDYIDYERDPRTGLEIESYPRRSTPPDGLSWYRTRKAIALA